MDKGVYIGLGVTVLFGLLPYMFKEMPVPIVWGGVALGAVLVVWPFVSFRSSFEGPLLLAAAGIIGLLTALAWGYSIHHTATASAKFLGKNSLEDLYSKAFPTLLSTEVKLEGSITVADSDVSLPFEIRFRLYRDFVSHSDFISIFIPSFKDSRLINAIPQILNNLPDELKKQRKALISSVGIGSKHPGAAYIEAKDLSFSGRVFVYTQNFLTPEQIGDVTKRYKEKGMFLEIRGSDFWAFNKDNP